MKFLILAFNPQHINQADLNELIDDLKFDFPGLKVHVIPHLQNNCDPIYTVQFADTSTK